MQAVDTPKGTALHPLRHPVVDEQNNQAQVPERLGKPPGLRARLPSSKAHGGPTIPSALDDELAKPAWNPVEARKHLSDEDCEHHCWYFVLFDGSAD
jgi:hypothetical protein